MYSIFGNVFKIRYDTIKDFNVASKAEYSALSSTSRMSWKMFWKFNVARTRTGRN